MVGPRLGRFNRDGTPNVIPGHSLTLVTLGTFILFFGWFGFNPGSTLAATDLRIAMIAVNTFLAGAAGAVVAIYFAFFRTGKLDLALACNGALAGLVGITAPCAYVAPWAAVLIGGIAALVMIGASAFVERVLRVDDVVGASAVHGFADLWGLLAVGIFADGTYGGVRGLIVGEWAQRESHGMGDGGHPRRPGVRLLPAPVGDPPAPDPSGPSIEQRRIHPLPAPGRSVTR
jgi:Amt family ammonium transporter